MTILTTRNRRVSLDDFATDSHAAKYRAELERHPDAALRLVGLLNDRANEQRLVDAEMHGMPALTGVVHAVESDDHIAAALSGGPVSYRFRQTVGVAIKLKMARLGWTTTGRKGTVRGARYFTKAEHYEVAHGATDFDSREKAMAALDAAERIGDEAERTETGRALGEALAAERAREGRVM